MGLYVSVGYLAELINQDREGEQFFEAEMVRINQVLAENSASGITEPRQAPKPRIQGPTSFSYHDLHYLRRAHAFVAGFKEEEFPAGTDLSRTDDDMMADVSCNLDSHLLCHSDAEGYYVPSRFVDPIFDERCPGTMLGSSYGLRAELDGVSHLLGVKVLGGEEGGAPGSLPESEHARLLKLESSDPLIRELRMWYCLWQATTLSIGQGYTIVFA